MCKNYWWQWASRRELSACWCGTCTGFLLVFRAVIHANQGKKCGLNQFQRFFSFWMNHSIRMKSQNRFQYRTLRTVYFLHSCDSIVNFGNGWNTVQVSSDRSVWNGIAQFKCSRNRSICAVSFTTMHLFVCVWILFVLLWIRLVHALLFFRVLFFFHWNFVCLLSCHFSCASRSFTPINLFFSSTSHTLCTWLFSIYLCCASCFCWFVRRERERVWPEAPMQYQKMRTNEHVCPVSICGYFLFEKYV